jgi:hypothetical protein
MHPPRRNLLAPTGQPRRNYADRIARSGYESSNPIAGLFRDERRDFDLRLRQGDKTPSELFLAGIHSLPSDLISAAKALATIDPESHDT